jgi:CheY-like chemotaxis protein
MAKILIVDDDVALRDSLAETVRDFGFEPRLATSGREALGVLASEEMQGVLLDLRMPGGMDGIEVLRRIRANSSGPPVVVLTAYASAISRRASLRSPCRPSPNRNTLKPSHHYPARTPCFAPGYRILHPP